MSPYESANPSPRRGRVPGATPGDTKRDLTPGVRGELVRRSRYLQKNSGFVRELVGSTGLSFETGQRAATGYLLARDAWGRGYATEALRAMVEVARGAGVLRLYALCHTDHAASVRVLEKAGFAREGTLRRYFVFPNLSPGEPLDVLCYALVLG